MMAQMMAQVKRRQCIKARLRTNGSQTDEETLVDGGHCCDALANMQRMEAKTGQLLAVLPDLEALKTCLT